VRSWASALAASHTLIANMSTAGFVSPPAFTMFAASVRFLTMNAPMADWFVAGEGIVMARLLPQVGLLDLWHVMPHD
jgi:hypothetical protein